MLSQQVQKINLNMQGKTCKKRKRKGEVQFVKMKRFDVQPNVETKQKERRSSISKDDVVRRAKQC